MGITSAWPTLGRLAVVGAADRDQARIDVDVALTQAAALSFAQARER